MSKKNKQKNIKTGYSCFEEKYRGWINPVKIVGRWRRNIKHAYQRIKYGYCDRDVWSIDWWFLNVVPNMLQDLRDIAHGFPSEIGEMVGYDDQHIDKAKEQESVDKWDSILAEIIFYLREANEERKLNAYRDECKNKGLELFSRWFWNLWD